MISRSQKLPSSAFLDRKYGVVRTPYFSLKISPNNLPFSRIGVVISKASVKSAVRRNFWKRQSALLPPFILGEPKDVIVIFSPKIKELTKAAFQEEFKKSLLKK